MANYVALATVTAKLPAGYTSTVSDNRISTVLIVQASNEVDDLAGPDFPRVHNSNAQKFPEITATPATPATIELCALWLTLSRVFEELSDLENRGDDEDTVPNKVYYRRLAEKKMAQVRDSEIDVGQVEPSVSVEYQNKYFDSDIEEDMDHILKKSEMDTLWP